jgi:hypothetical protein
MTLEGFQVELCFHMFLRSVRRTFFFWLLARPVNHFRLKIDTVELQMIAQYFVM